MNRSLIQAGRWRDGCSCSCIERSRSGAGGQQTFSRHFGAWVNCQIQCFGRAQTNKLRNTHDTSPEPLMIYLMLASSTETLISSETHRTWNKHTAPLAKQDLVELCLHCVVNRLQKCRLFVLKRACYFRVDFNPATTVFISRKMFLPETRWKLVLIMCNNLKNQHVWQINRICFTCPSG